MMRALLALLVVTAPAHAEGLLPGGTIHLAVTPDHLVLGKDARAQVTLSVSDAAGQRVDVEGLEILASAGRVERPERTATGQYTATYRPPRVGFPHVAWILARGRTPSGQVAGVALLPLWGQGALSVRTKPDAQVTLRIGDEVFGPVSADTQGRASIPVVARPGSTTGYAVSVDAAGNDTSELVDLAVPPFNRIALFPMAPLPAGGTAPVLLLAVDGDGGALAHGDFNVGADRATVAEIRKLSDGVWRVELRGPEYVGNGRVLVHAELEGHKQSTADAAISVVAGPAANARLQLTPGHHRTGDTAPIAVTARFHDAFGNPVPASDVELVPSTGVLENVTSSAGGVIKAQWRLVDEAGAATQATLAVKRKDGTVLGEGHVSLIAGAAERVVVGNPVKLERDDLPVGSYEIHVGAQDAAGKPVSGSVLSVQSPDGVMLVARRLLPDGSQVLTVVAPERGKAGNARLVVQSDHGASETVMVPVTVRHNPFVRVTPKIAAQWNVGRLVLGGGALDATLGVPLPIMRLPVRLSVVTTLTAGGMAAMPVHWDFRRLFFTVPVLANVGLELGWRRFLVGAQLGGGFYAVHARIAQKGQSPIALLGLGDVPLVGKLGNVAQLHGIGPSMSARFSLGFKLGPGVLASDIRFDAPFILGGNLHGFMGGVTTGMGYGWTF